MDEATEIGPLATEQILKDVDEQVKTSVAAGAIVLTGGKKFDRPGNFYEPTVLTNIPKDSPAYSEEIFGPVALLFRVNDIDEAIQLANDTTFGLGSSAWTNDESERNRFIDKLEAGCVFINSMVASDPRLPFGGIKNSGYGRELGEFGIREFVNIKTVSIN
jgi:succinate-semialdehyde dehydrogenase/glutarate-semialdehyde dehydrogenase